MSKNTLLLTETADTVSTELRHRNQLRRNQHRNQRRNHHRNQHCD